MIFVFENDITSTLVNTMVLGLFFYVILLIFRMIKLQREIKRKKLISKISILRQKFYNLKCSFYDNAEFLKGRRLYEKEKELDDLIETFEFLKRKNKNLLSEKSWEFQKSGFFYRKKIKRKSKFIGIEDE